MILKNLNRVRTHYTGEIVSNHSFFLSLLSSIPLNPTGNSKLSLLKVSSEKLMNKPLIVFFHVTLNLQI